MAGALALSSALAVSSPAFARDTGFELGGRLGYGVPMGDASGDPGDELSSTVSGMLALQLDVGARVARHIMAGAYFQSGLGFQGDQARRVCGVIGADCTPRIYRLGIQGQFHFLPQGRFDPWVGVGFGYEWLSLSAEDKTAFANVEVTATARGWEFVQFQAGLDLEAGKRAWGRSSACLWPSTGAPRRTAAARGAATSSRPATRSTTRRSTSGC